MQEVTALLWALELAVKENFKRIVVEGNAKNRFDTLNGDPCNANSLTPFMFFYIVVLTPPFLDLFGKLGGTFSGILILSISR